MLKGVRRMRVPKWAIGAGVAILLAGGGAITAGVASAAASGGANPVSSFVSSLAANLGIPVSTLQSALQKTESSQVQQLLQSGRITAATAQRLQQRIQSGQGLPLGPMGGGWARPGGPGRGGLLQAASQYLGVSVAQLRTDLGGGKSLAAVAGGIAGKSAAGLQAALLTAEQTRLQQAVTAGRLTAAQEQAALSRFQTQLPALLARTGPAPGPQGGFGPGRGHWGGPGAPASGTSSSTGTA